MLIGLVPLLTLAWLDIQTLGALGASLAEELAVSLTEQARANLVQQATANAARASREIELMDYSLRLQAQAAMGPAGAPQSQAAVRQRLADFLTRRQLPQAAHIVLSSLIFPDGTHTSFPARAKLDPGIANTAADWARARPAKNLTHWLVPPAADPGMLVGLRRLAGTGKAGTGVTTMALALPSLLESSSLSPPFNAGALILLVSTEGRVAYVHQGSPLKALTRGAALVLDDGGQQQGLLHDLKHLAASERGARFQGRDYLCLHRALSRTGFHLVWLVPTEAATGLARDAGAYALANTRRQTDALIPFLLTVALLIVLAAFYASRSVTGPVSRLKSVVQAVADGDFSARVSIHTGDELEALGAAFNQMIPQLAEQTRLQESLALAREAQQRLLPEAAPSFPGLDIAGQTRYCEQTGGDYFDYLDGRPHGREALGVVVGDVAGHGVAAALLMTTARALLHGMSATSGEIERTLQQLNLQLAGDVRPGHFMTLFYLQIDRQQQRLRYASAGHDPIIWWHADTGQCTTLAGLDIPLGIDPQWQFSPAMEAVFTVGDVFLLATDGVWETRSATGEPFGKARLESLLARHARESARDILEAVLHDLSAFAHDTAPRDDVTVVVVRIDLPPALA